MNSKGKIIFIFIVIYSRIIVKFKAKMQSVE